MFQLSLSYRLPYYSARQTSILSQDASVPVNVADWSISQYLYDKKTVQVLILCRVNNHEHGCNLRHQDLLSMATLRSPARQLFCRAR